MKPTAISPMGSPVAGETAVGDGLRGRLEVMLGAGAVRRPPDGPLTVFPTKEAEVADLVLLCREARVPLVPTGGQSLMEIGGPPPTGALRVSLQRLERLIEHDDANLTATVEAGMTIGVLQRLLSGRAQFAALDPPYPDRATVGGLVAANVNGYRRTGYRSIRDLVIGIRVVTGKGEIVKAGGKVVKNVAGYDMCKLFVGSLGTLGILTQITVRVEPQPEEDGTLIVTDGAIGQSAEAVAGSRLHPTAVVLLGGSAMPGILEGRGAAALIRVEGFRAAVERQAAEVNAIAPGTRRLSGEAHVRLWGRVARFGWEGPASLVRLMVPRSSLLGVWEELVRIPECGVVADVLSGVLWVSLDAATGREQMAGVTAAAVRAGGHFLIARAPGMEGTPRAGPVPETLPLMQALKHAFDPDGILNPGRFPA